MVLFPATSKNGIERTTIENGIKLLGPPFGQANITGKFEDDGEPWHRSAPEWIHAGIDLVPSDGRGAGAVIESPGRGEVVAVRLHDPGPMTFGRYVQIKHDHVVSGKKYWTAYAHMDSINVEVGQHVNVGDRLGTMGGTGGVDPHLHWQCASSFGDAVTTYANANKYHLVNPLLFTGDGVPDSSFLDPRVLAAYRRAGAGGSGSATVGDDGAPLYVPRFESSRIAAGAVPRRIVRFRLYGEGLTPLTLTESLKITFEMDTGTDSPRPGKVSVYNLSDDKVDLLLLSVPYDSPAGVVGGSRRDVPPVYYSLSGGYDADSLLCVGEVRRIRDYWETPDRRTEFELGINDSKSSNTVDIRIDDEPVYKLFANAAAQQGLEFGPHDHIPELRDYKITENGTYGATELVKKWADSMNLFPAYHCGQLILLRGSDYGSVIEDDAEVLVLSEETGLIGTPTRTETGLEAKVQLTPLIAPNSIIRIRARQVEGLGDTAAVLGEQLYRVINVKFRGDSWEGDFMTEFDAGYASEEGLQYIDTGS